ncbi:hypothetical protein ACAM_1645 [Aeropyrum camini SY1 = JCM 12091]|uniref:Uncharacterized protein n=1 Tax=Aeropyrum camini SY1 = JCM 12091 TaxID=1198449 RepID=U3TIF6_9CREN|nr:hypothetical protein ACAM_1645 [Aeropyrum camini SY1 = JCM 12091]
MCVLLIVILVLAILTPTITYIHEHNNRLDSIQRTALYGAYEESKRLAHLGTWLSLLRNDLEKYDCNFTHFEDSEPGKAAMYKSMLEDERDALVELNRYLQIAYSGAGLEMPFELREGFLNMETYLNVLILDIVRNHLNCSQLPDTQLSEEIDKVFQDLKEELYAFSNGKNNPPFTGVSREVASEIFNLSKNLISLG